MRISVIQMSPGTDKAANIAQLTTLVDRAVAEDRAELVVLPEVWSSLGGDRAIKFTNAEDLHDPDALGPDSAYSALRTLARRHGIVVHGGSIIEAAGDRLCNTSLIFGPDGQELARYRKIHLFDVVTPSGETYRESDTYGAGDQVVTFTLGDLVVGCAICYDLRFGELFLRLRQRGAELILLPAAFTMETGAAHWETLIRARAIETQCWIAAAGTTGRHVDAGGGARLTYGHSMLVDPWGTVAAQASHGVGWATGCLDREVTRRVRADMPVATHRRLLLQPVAASG